jgi:hypothetical protein
MRLHKSLDILTEVLVRRSQFGVRIPEAVAAVFSSEFRPDRTCTEPPVQRVTGNYPRGKLLAP